MKEKAFISFVVQVERGGRADESLLFSLDRYLTEKFENRELVIVDNTGNPAYYDSLIELSRQFQSLTSVLKLSRKQPSEVALLAGVDKCIGDYIFQMEHLVKDFEFSLIESLFKKSSYGADIVSAVPNRVQVSISKIFYFLFNRVSSLAFPLETERVVLTSRRALNAALNTKQRFRYQKALLNMTGFERAVVRYEPVAPVQLNGKSFLERAGLAMDLFIAYSAIGVKLGLILCAGFIGFTGMICVYVVASYFLRKDINSGWTSMMLFLSVSFSGLFFMLSIVGEYLRHILLEIQGGSLYVVEKYHTSRKTPYLRLVEEKAA